jgi:hypothetical protein
MDVRLIQGLVYLDGLHIQSPLVGRLQKYGQDRVILLTRSLRAVVLLTRL